MGFANTGGGEHVTQAAMRREHFLALRAARKPRHKAGETRRPIRERERERLCQPLSKSGGGGPFERQPRREIRHQYDTGGPEMNAHWRKSSHSGHAGQNCVEITLSIAGNTRIDQSISPQKTRAEIRPGLRVFGYTGLVSTSTHAPPRV
jgi:hypothetical protein